MIYISMTVAIKWNFDTAPGETLKEKYEDLYCTLDKILPGCSATFHAPLPVIMLLCASNSSGDLSPIRLPNGSQWVFIYDELVQDDVLVVRLWIKNGNSVYLKSNKPFSQIPASAICSRSWRNKWRKHWKTQLVPVTVRFTTSSSSSLPGSNNTFRTDW